MSSPRPNIARRRREKNRKRQERLKRKQAPQPVGAQTAVAGWDGLEKMSDVLEQFVEPYMEEMTSDERGFRYLLTLGAAAWNAALLPEDRRVAVIDAILSKLQASGANQEFARALLQKLIDRKNAYFSANRRSIIHFVLTDTGDGYYLNVVSTFPVPPDS